MDILKVENLCKTYGVGETKVEALKNASFTIAKGEFAAVIGPSGSGKSTLLNMLGALDFPTSGKVMVDNRDIYTMKEEELSVFRRRNIGFVFQAYNLVPELNVEENMVLPLLLDYKKPDRAYIDELMNILGLTDRKHHLPAQLSGGQQQRVAIGRALATKPAIVLADEPTGNLDSKNSKDVINLLKLSVERYSQTLIMITHNQDYAAYADRVFHVEDGVVTELGGCQMNSYLAITPKYLAAHKKNTKLTVISVMVAVALVTTIFSMLDVFWTFEKQQTISDYGNYHIMVKNATEEEAASIAARIDVERAVRYCQLDDAVLNGHAAVIATGDSDVSEIFSEGLYNRYSILQGAYPEGKNEIAVEAWAAENYGLKIGDIVTVSLGGVTKQFQISGICANLSTTQSEVVIGMLIPLEGERCLKPDLPMQLLVRFKDHVNINKAQQAIMSTLNITKDRIAHNERLLALLGQSVNNTVLGIYGTGTILFLLVLVAGVTMICNTFNISVMDRIRQFGLLRCIGASKKQIKKLVRHEGRTIVLRAIPLGVLIGILLTFGCSAILKFYNSSFFTDIPLFSVSAAGILAGVLIGLLTVSLASLSPAKKASRVSPVNAVSGGDEQVPGKKGKESLSGRLRVETALGIRNAVSKRKTLVLMSASIAISVILFLGFQVFVNFTYSSMKTLKPYTADVSIYSKNGLDYGLYTKLSGLNGVKRVYGRMFGYVDATFDASRLTELYKKAVGKISVSSDGTFIAPEKSWLISYDKSQLKWAKTDLVKGTLSEEKLNQNNGVIAVVLNNRKGVSMETAGLQLGDKVTMQTASGPKEYTVMALLRSVPFADSNLNLTTFITTEKLYTEITGDSTLDVIDIQLKGKNQAQTVSKIKNLAGADATFSDSRQKNAETTQAFLTMAVFMYGFVLVIALISILNIINTMQTSVSAKTKYIGVMRAVGMSDKQLHKMIISEAGTYGITGCIAGVLLGAALQWFLIKKFLPGAHMTWQFPTLQVVLIFILVLMVILLSVVGPLKKIQSKGISDTIGSLQ